MVSLAVKVGGLDLANPVLTASGTFGYGLEFAAYTDLDRLGGVVVKGLSVEPKEGNPTPRIAETPSGMLNSIGLQNVGVRCFVEEKLPQLARYRCRVVANFFGYTPEEFAEAARMLDGAPGLHALECNISCPNVQGGNLIFGSRPESAHQVVKLARAQTSLPLIVKLSPNVTDVVEIAQAVVEAGADALSLINTLLGMSIDVETRRPRLARGFGGLSGPAVRPVAVYQTWRVAQAVDVPVIGMGGIMEARDALEFLMAGARAVQVGTANFVDPAAAEKVVDGLERWCAEHSVEDINDIVGTLEME